MEKVIMKKQKVPRFLMKKVSFLKVIGICLVLCAGLFLFTTYLQAATPTYIELDCSDIDYDEAQYLKFIIDSDEDFDIYLYMKDNDNNTFYVIYQTENNVDTGDFDKDDDDELFIYLDEDEYVTGHDETFDSFEHSNGLMSFDEYINNQWKEHEYNGGSAELEKIRIFGNEFKLYYMAIDDDGDFEDPIWEFQPGVDYDAKDPLGDFEGDGHTYSTTTDIDFLIDYIHITRDAAAAAGVGYEGLPLIYWNQPSYGWNQPYNYQPFPNFSNWNWTSPTTAYNPNPFSGGGVHLFVSYPEGGAWQSPYYQQTGYYPWNQPYNYGWNQPYLSGNNYWNFPLLNQDLNQGYVNYIDKYGRGYRPGLVLNSDAGGNYLWTPPGWIID